MDHPQEIAKRPEQVHEDWWRGVRARWLGRLNWLYWLDRRPAYYAALEAERLRRMENLDPYQAVIKEEEDEARRAKLREAQSAGGLTNAATIKGRNEQILKLVRWIVRTYDLPRANAINLLAENPSKIVA